MQDSDISLRQALARVRDGVAVTAIIKGQRVVICHEDGSYFITFIDMPSVVVTSASFDGIAASVREALAKVRVLR